MKIILLGPPGAGKGTQAVSIATKVGVAPISSGDLFRKHQREGTELGRMAKSYMERGDYVPDDVTIRMIMEWINAPEQANGFVLDGFPRTVGQAQALDRELEVDKVLYIKVSEAELIRRLAGRIICRQCQKPFRREDVPERDLEKCKECGGELYQRDDDKPEVVQKRLQVYSEETEPVIEYYRQAGRLHEIDGEGSVVEVERALLATVT